MTGSGAEPPFVVRSFYRDFVETNLLRNHRNERRYLHEKRNKNPLQDSQKTRQNRLSSALSRNMRIPAAHSLRRGWRGRRGNRYRGRVRGGQSLSRHLSRERAGICLSARGGHDRGRKGRLRKHAADRRQPILPDQERGGRKRDPEHLPLFHLHPGPDGRPPGLADGQRPLGTRVLYLRAGLQHVADRQCLLRGLQPAEALPLQIRRGGQEPGLPGNHGTTGKGHLHTRPGHGQPGPCLRLH